MMQDTGLELMGFDISAKTGYDGVDILKVLYHALTDANFHHEAEIIEQMVTAIESTADEVRFTLTHEVVSNE